MTDNHSSRPASHVFQPAHDEPLAADGDVVIIGAGLAGLFTALKLSPMPVTVVAAAPLGQGASTGWAQGGVASAMGSTDRPEFHAADTIAAGAGTVDEDVARFVAEEGPDRIADLIGYGVPFDREPDGTFALSREAAHSHRRVAHVSGDRTGASILETLVARVRATPSIRVLEGYEADELLMADDRVEGVRLVRAAEHGHEVYEYVPACAVVLATGGVGALYAVTTNPAYARGESIAMAARAGAVIADAEFVQFHPTAIDAGLDPAPLATEALRGEGATLINSLGERFMLPLDPRAELGPRDVVARAVFKEIAEGRGVFLDCRTAVGAHFPAAFPTVYALCRNAGIDPVSQPIPVAPAAHYHMGGIATDARGRSSVPGLWAVGEVASTGLHGANRLASNSLLEAMVFGARAATDIAALGRGTRHTRTDLQRVGDIVPDHSLSRSAAVARLRKTMSDDVGVVRSAAGLRKAIATLRDIERAAGSDRVLANMALAGRFIAVGALLREESRGAQLRSDFTDANPQFGHRAFLKLSDVDAIGNRPAAVADAALSAWQWQAGAAR
ncbi:L-aspartate oxidase [Hyphomicrobium sulfonivorans]|uniref:L-aspartate oxidase n=1 Tax=Hyphomicrobium sulfonivorans TaxID=121290 RepID=UPI00156F1DA1|nr:L-aspartate oxidase [Hyphomicrobium sulfonivorans]MBI1649751.1 L-aspartate oxidase [Hyphomicrobium sulfonivorans]NSL71667.1 L-aspartate oxidase [Hyphomicrobium sulfonivorans]